MARQFKIMIPEEDIRKLAFQLLFALRHLHRRSVIHMDVKPLNVFLTSQATMKLGDVGLAIRTEMLEY